MKRQWLRASSGLIALLFALSIFEILSSFDLLDSRLFPRPSVAISRLLDLLINNESGSAGNFYDHLKQSALRFSLGVSIAAVMSLVLVIASSFSFIAKYVSSSIIGFLYPLPKSALFPLLLLVFGIRNGAHVALIVIGSVALMLATSLAGLQRLEAAGYLELARALQLNKRTMIRRVLIPGLMPEFMHSLKLGLSYGLVLLIVGEMVVTRQGVGVLLWTAWEQFNFVDLFAIFYLISFSGFVIFAVFDWLGSIYSTSQRAA